jgi:hypothetical protein
MGRNAAGGPGGEPLGEEARIDLGRSLSMGFDFERFWLEKLRGRLEVDLGPEAAAELMSGSESLSDESSEEERTAWTGKLLERLADAAGETAAREIMLGCACLPPRARLEEARKVYAGTGSVESARQVLERDFRDFLTSGLGLDEGTAEEIVARGWGMAGAIRDGSVVATKIPKSGSLRDYLAETDPEGRRALYCHCPRVRHLVGSGRELPELYCYCGGGFYRFIWEYVLDGPVQVELLASVMGGDDVCSFAVTPLDRSVR